MEKIKLDHFLILYKKIDSNWIKYLNIRANSIGLLRGNIGANLHDFEFCKGFLRMIPKSWAAATSKVNKTGLSKIKTFCASRDTIRKIKRKPIKWDKIFANHVYDKGSVSRIYKESLQCNKKKKPSVKLGTISGKLVTHLKKK